MTLDQQFTALYEKLQHLLRQYGRLTLENDKLRQELEEARQREAAALGRTEELQQQISILKFAAGEMSDRDKKVFERKLAKYVKEIDKVIAHLSQ